MDGSLIVALIIGMTALVLGGLALVGAVYAVYTAYMMERQLEAHGAEHSTCPNMASAAHEREFQVLSRAWTLLQAVDSKLKAAVHHAHKRPVHMCLDEAMRAIDRLHRYFVVNKIFVHGELLDAYRRVDAVLVEIRTDCDRMDIDRDKLLEYLRRIEAASSKIEELTRKRLSQL